MNIKEQPTWDEGVKIKEFPILSKDIACDVAIVGAGITGLTLAYLLKNSGKKVIILEKDRIGHGATGVTTAFITQSLDTSYKNLIDIYGVRSARLVVNAHGDAKNFIEGVIRENQIDCEYEECDNYTYAEDEDDIKDLEVELEAGKKLGIPLSIEKDEELGFKNAGYLKLKNQAKFHPRKYLKGLTDAVEKAGVEIYENTEVGVVRDTKPYHLSTKGGNIVAHNVVFATHKPIDDELKFRKGTYQSYVYELEIDKNKIKEGLYEDMRDPYHYFRVEKMKDGKDRMIVGGEDHRKDIPIDPSKNFQALEDFVKNNFSYLNYKIVRKWYGDIIEPSDGLASIGRVDEGIDKFYATGYSGNGMTHSQIAAKIIADDIMGEINPYAEIYKANRKPKLEALAKKGIEYTEELIHGAIRNSLRYRKK